MGVDIKAIIRHKMSAKMALSFPDEIDTWEEIKALKGEDTYMLSKKTAWQCPKQLTENALLDLWDYYEDDSIIPSKPQGCSNTIECFVGWINVFKNTLVVTHFPEHKYGNIGHPYYAKKIISINRSIARRVGSEEIIYCTDSTYPTAILEELAREGKDLEQIKEYGINIFGIPPKGIDEGRKYMFFIDNVNEEIGEIPEWDDWEEYWKINPETGDLELTQKAN